MSKIWGLIGITLLGAVIYILFLIDQKSSPQSHICCRGTCFNLEIATTPEEKQQGLMYRSRLADTRGMIFVYDEEEIYPFWMKNTRIPLDMIRIDQNVKIVDIQEASPCMQDICPSYIPATWAQYVLEINQGISKKNWINIWDQCILSL